MNIKIFSHNDLDGVSCTAILKYICSQHKDWKLEAVHCTYTDIDNNIQQFLLSKKCRKTDIIYITDISVSDDTANMLDESVNGKVILIDHHNTSEALNKFKWVVAKTNIGGRLTCGTELLYKILITEGIISDNDSAKLASLTELVRLWDTWDWKESDVGSTAKNLNTLFKYFGIKEYIEWFINKALSTDVCTQSVCNFESVYDDKDKLIIEILNKKEERYIKRSVNSNLTVKDIWGYKTAIVTAEEYISDVGHAALEKYPNIDIAAVVNFNTMTCSLRARNEDNIDVSEIAREYGGGGHTKSSAFNISPELKENFFRQMIITDQNKT